MKFCFVCGKKTERLIDGYCEDCYSKSSSLVEIPKNLFITQCRRCGKIKQSGLWLAIGREDFIKNNIKVLGKNVKIIVDKDKIIVKGTLSHSKKPKEEIHEIKLLTKKGLCLECTKELSGYYESIIQLRGEYYNEALVFIEKQIKTKTFFRIEAIKQGINLYIGNKDIANQIVEDLKRRYKLEIKKSFKLHTKKEGKDVYKSIFLIRCD